MGAVRIIVVDAEKKNTGSALQQRRARPTTRKQVTHLQRGHADAPIKSRRSKRKPGAHVLLTQITETGEKSHNTSKEGRKGQRHGRDPQTCCPISDLWQLRAASNRARERDCFRLHIILLCSLRPTTRKETYFQGGYCCCRHAPLSLPPATNGTI